MNGHILRGRWAEPLENSDEFEAAKFAATRDHVARRARLVAIRQRYAGNPVKLSAALAAENAAAGTGVGGIQLKALREHHENTVRDCVRYGSVRTVLPASTISLRSVPLAVSST